MKQYHQELCISSRINICDTHFKRNAIDSFLKRIITAMKNESSTIMLLEKYNGPSMMNQHKPYQKLNCIKKDHAINLMGLQRCCVF